MHSCLAPKLSPYQQDPHLNITATLWLANLLDKSKKNYCVQYSVCGMQIHYVLCTMYCLQIKKTQLLFLLCPALIHHHSSARTSLHLQYLHNRLLLWNLINYLSSVFRFAQLKINNHAAILYDLQVMLQPLPPTMGQMSKVQQVDS